MDFSAATNCKLGRMQMKTRRAFTGLRYAAALLLVLGVVSVVSMAAARPAVVGDWNGVLDVGGGNSLHLVVHVTQKDDGSLTGTLDSVDQNANGIPMTAITYKDGALHFECSSIGGSYDGKMKGDSEIDGTWSQGGGSLALNLTKSK
jgi:hypothetical protein